MGVYGGPNLVSSNLTLSYDMSNTVKSWKGAPTTNIVTAPDTNNITSTDIPSDALNAGITGYSSYNSGYAVHTLSTTSTASTGKTFTYSLWMRSSSSPSSTYLMYVYDGTGPDSGWWNFGSGSLTSDWVRYTGSRSDMTGTVTSIRIYRLNQAGTIEICAPQIEVSSFATPFVQGTRSSTQALLDLTNSYTLTPTNVAYNSNNTFSFSNSWFDLNSNNIITGTQAFTVESWYQTTGTTADEIFGNYGAGSVTNTLWISGRYGVYINSSVYFPGAPIGAGTYQIVVTRDASGNIVLYRNGVQQNTGILSASIAVTFNFRIGADVNGGGEPFTGTINSVTVYNRALTATEVKQNFEARRIRYGV